MSGLRFPGQSFDELCSALLADRAREACGIAYAVHDPRTSTWIVREALPAPEAAYEQRDAFAATLGSGFVVDVANRCRAADEAAVFIHTHPRAVGAPRFSPIDDAGESQLRSYMDRRGGNRVHLAMVIGPDGCRARHLGGATEVEVWQVGDKLTLASGLEGNGGVDDRHDRQVRAFGAPGQRILRRLRVGIVGLGGTGSVVLQQLVHLGIADVTIVDPDTVETSNLNRLLGAGHNDVGRPKVDVAADAARRIDPATQVVAMQRDVVDEEVAHNLLGLDFMFSCTDSHASRLVIAQLAYQHLVPAIDMGVSITVAQGRVTHVTGRVQMLSPGLACLLCSNALDAEAIRRETMTPEQRAADPYVHGIHEPQPAVITLNSTMASLATTMFLGAVSRVPAAARFQYYDGIRGTVRPTIVSCTTDCILCSPSGGLARGVSLPMATRPARMRGEIS